MTEEPPQAVATERICPRALSGQQKAPAARALRGLDDFNE
jgi:hypothetical protein